MPELVAFIFLVALVFWAGLETRDRLRDRRRGRISNGETE